MSADIERLEAELELAKLSQELETAREAMHEDRSDEVKMAKYKEMSNKVAAARSDFRAKYTPPPPELGDAVASVSPIEAGAGVVDQ